MASKAFRIVKDEDQGFLAFFGGIKELSKEKRIKVGIQGKQAEEIHTDSDGGLGDITMVRLGAVHEFGATIDNGFGKGIKITIPQRSFLRSTADANEGKYRKAMQKIVRKLVNAPKKFNADAELMLLGERVRADVILRIKRRIPPPLKPRTIARKGEDVPLIDTGMLVNSIRTVVE